MKKIYFCLACILSLSACNLGMDKWGNVISFENELGIRIDSLEMIVCQTRSLLYVDEDSAGNRYIDEHPRFPDSGYPCPVKMKVYSEGKEIILEADTFDCYHCDNAKYYILRDGKAIFQVYYTVEEETPTIDKSEEMRALGDHEAKNDSQTNFATSAQKFVQSLQAGESLASFFQDNWTFVYHEDNRCDGATDGQSTSLTKARIDGVIRLPVKNDGDGWACEKKEPSTYEVDFDLKKEIAKWDRFEMEENENQADKIVYVLGGGESDFVILHYGE
ncbi:MAG: hypothetical protein AAF206_29110, partial [Bacteroidota bacterium]